MYFGAGWNTNPLPSPAEMMAEHHGIRVDTPYYTEFWFVPYWPFGSFRSLIFFVKPKLFHFQAVVTHVMSNSPFWADFIYFVVIWFASPALSRPTPLSRAQFKCHSIAKSSPSPLIITCVDESVIEPFVLTDSVSARLHSGVRSSGAFSYFTRVSFTLLGWAKLPTPNSSTTR